MRFATNGYPDFSPYSIKTVKIEGMTGIYARDARAANWLAGYSRTPRGYVWHHHEDALTMQLIPRDLHNAVQHTGGASTLRR
nr:HNH endonuclease [Streptomyces sp. NBRC 14336]WBO82443.1 HNH endonuclease [Streptomyces sp. SBE_14.2]